MQLYIQLLRAFYVLKTIVYFPYVKYFPVFNL